MQEPLRLCVLHQFNAVKADPSQYMIPGEITAITQGPAGDNDFYGAASTGGMFGEGAIFHIPYVKDVGKPTNGSTVHYDFNAGADGTNPQGGVVVGPDGFLYGTTYGGGTHDVGTVFKISRSGGPPQVITLANFGDVKATVPLSTNPQPTAEDLKNVNGGYPQSPLAMGNDGNVYGVTAAANGARTGTIFRVSTSGNLEYFYLFMTQGAKDYGTQPYTISAGKDGFLYGTTISGGQGFGTIFQFDPHKSGADAIKTLYKFREGMTNASDDDGNIANPLIQGSDGTLYGTARLGGPNGRGVVFSLTKGGTYKVLYAIGGRESNPGAGLVLVHQKVPTVRPLPPPAASCGTGASTAPAPGPTAADAADYLYGVATMNGVAFGGDLGIIFRLRADGTDFATVYNFDSQSGAAPDVAPVLGNDNNLYGTTAGGSPYNGGVFWRLNTAYLVTGQPEPGILYGTNEPRDRVQFQGNWRTHIWNDPLMQVVTDIAVYRGEQTACSQATTLHGIIVRMKDPSTRILQFFYRERLNITKNVAGGTVLVPVAGVTDANGYQLLPYFDLTETYKTGDEVANRQSDGTYLAYTSLKDENKGVAPPAKGTAAAGQATNASWKQNGDCDGTVHQCIPLTTNEMAPNWVPDAEPPSDLYMKQDIQQDCDGTESFDTPSFYEDQPNVEQRFVGYTIGVTTPSGSPAPLAQVIGAAKWRIVKTGTQELQYWVPAMSGTPDAGVLKQLHDLLVQHGFVPDF